MNIKILAILMLAAAFVLAACGKSDADLQKAANDKLAADKVAGVTVAVKDGVATLTGEIADITVKPKAEASVKSVEGIKSVDSTKLTEMARKSITAGASSPIRSFSMTERNVAFIFSENGSFLTMRSANN